MLSARVAPCLFYARARVVVVHHGASLANAVSAVGVDGHVETTVTVGKRVAFSGSVDARGLRALLIALPMVSADTATVAFTGYSGVFYRGGGGKPVDEYI